METECFLSPELLLKLKKNESLENEKAINYEKTDVFSLGLICLGMANLTNMDVVYDYENSIIKEDILLTLLE